MSEKFEQAEIYIKELMAMPIELAVRDINQQLKNDREVPGLILMVTGGQAIQTYFPNSPQLRTHDFDLKLIAPKQTVYTPAVRSRMTLLAKGIARYIELALNKYVKSLPLDISQDLMSRFGLELVLNDEGNMFSASTNLRIDLLNIVTFTLRDSIKRRTNSISDIYVVDPSEIDHYLTFTGLSGSNELLSEEGGDYYIPYRTINEVPFAGMGYIIWDTLRMVDDSKAKGLKKYPRYVEKRDAIFNALNRPDSKLSCNAMKDYMLNCEKAYQECRIKSRIFTKADDLIRYGITEGILPPDSLFINRIRRTYDVNYLCESLKRILE
jgi:hypothetical protein